MSQLFDSLRRGSQRPREPRRTADDRAARADAVLATLGYRTRRARLSGALPTVFLLLLAVVAGWYWWTWPARDERTAAARPPAFAAARESTSASTPGVQSQPAPAVIDTPAVPAGPGSAPPDEVPRALPSAKVEPAPSLRSRVPAARLERRAPSPSRGTAAAARAPVSAELPPPSPQKTAESPAELFRLAVYHQRAGDFSRAQAHYRMLLERNELDPRVHNNLGLLYRDHGMLDFATREFQRALIINPDYLTARNNLGVALLAQSRLDEAAAEFRRVLARDARNVDAAVNLALVEKAAGRPEAAKESLLRTLMVDAGHAPAHFNLAAIYEQTGESARAVEHYQAFLQHADAEHQSRAADARARIAALSGPR